MCVVRLLAAAALASFGLVLQVEAKKTTSYNTTRNSFIELEERMAVGGNLVLNSKEALVNAFLMYFKETEHAEGFDDPSKFLAAKLFFDAKEDIEKSPVFDFIRKMPKGGILHGHNTAMVSSEWVIKNLTYRDDLMMCLTETSPPVLILGFRTWSGCTGGYTKVKTVRAQAKNVAAFDQWLDRQINLRDPNSNDVYPDVNVVWARFQNMFSTISDLLTFRPAYEDYHYQLLQELYDDGINYAEIRTSLPYLYELDGTEYDRLQAVKILQNVVERFKRNNPGFYGVRLIYSSSRSAANSVVSDRIKLYKTVRNAYPDFLVGFDLVGQEDLGKPLWKFVAELNAAEDGTKFFFHAGETNWYGAETDWNLLDAVLLNTARIGHGFALVKHPAIEEAIRQRGIAIEINPISNQVLSLVRDLRNHPGASYIAQGLPLVVSCDDPGFWSAKGVSYDMYYAFMAMASRTADLRFLKQLAVNTFRYSALDPSEKIAALRLFQTHWDTFLVSYAAGQSKETISGVIDMVSQGPFSRENKKLLADLKELVRQNQVTKRKSNR